MKGFGCLVINLLGHKLKLGEVAEKTTLSGVLVSL